MEIEYSLFGRLHRFLRSNDIYHLFDIYCNDDEPDSYTGEKIAYNPSDDCIWSKDYYGQVRVLTGDTNQFKSILDSFAEAT